MWLASEVAIRAVVGTLLVAAGGLKLISTPVWRDVWIASYRLLPGSLVPPVARSLPLAELACGLALLVGATGGAAAASVVLGVLTLAVVSVLVRGLQVSCHCFGRLSKLLTWPVVVRNLGFVAACAVVAVHGYEAPALATLPWLMQAIVLTLVVATVVGLLVAYRGARQQRYLTKLVRASRIGAGTRPNQPSNPTPTKEPVTTGGA